MSFLQIVETTFFLSFLVLFHEVGHFLSARLIGLPVEEFGIGYPPRLVGKKLGDTVFSLNIIPFGGFCGFSHEKLYSRPWYQQVLVIFSGVAFNFILGWIFLSILFGVGNPYLEGKVKIADVNPQSPAAEVGIKPGDVVVSVGEEKVRDTSTLIFYTTENAGEPIELRVNRPGAGEKSFEIIPRKDPPEGQGALGVSLNFEGEEKYERVVFWKAPLRGFRESISILDNMLTGLLLMVKRLVFEGIVPKEVAGPVGVYDLTSQAAALGFRYLLQFLSFLSLNLALLNLFPIPALDGGQLVFVAIEGVAGRRISTEVKQVVNGIGMALLALLAILVTVQDVQRLV